MQSRQVDAEMVRSGQGEAERAHTSPAEEYQGIWPSTPSPHRGSMRALQRYRTGEEGRISHLKRRYGMGRSRLKGHEGQKIWTEWGILAYDADTLDVRAR